MFNSKVWIAASLVILVAVGCSKRSEEMNDPKKTLSSYISKSFAISGVEDRRELLNYLTGEAKTRLAAWSDEQFRQAFVDSKRKFLRLVFFEVKQVSVDDVNITYEISYVDENKGRNAKVTNKKFCQLIQADGKWLIRDVRNIKELVEYQNEMSLP